MNTIQTFIEDEMNVEIVMYDTAKRFYRDFVRQFPREKITSIPLNDFVFSAKGCGFDNTFCVQIRYSPLASMGNAFPATFEVYYKQGAGYTLSPTYKKYGKDIDAAFVALKQEIVKLLNAGEKKDFLTIGKCKISQNFKLMLLAIYLPNDYFPAPSRDILLAYCEGAMIPFDSNDSLARLNNRLVEWKKTIPEMQEWNSFALMRYLDWLLKNEITCDGKDYYYSFYDNHERKGEGKKLVKSEYVIIDNVAPIPVNPIEEVEYLKEVANSQEIESVSADFTNTPEIPPAAIITSSGKAYKRDPAKSKIALSRADYKCEFNRYHESFIRASNGKRYTEPHHLIPISQQGNFEYSLDVPANIVSLCSNCHNCIHYGKERNVLLKALYDARKDQLKEAGILITFEDLVKMYE